MKALICGLAAVFALAPAALAQPAPPPPVEAYGRLPAIGDAALSPDGRRLALSVGFAYRAAAPDRDLTAFRIVNIDTGAIERTFAPPPRNTFRGVGWADDGRPTFM